MNRGFQTMQRTAAVLLGLAALTFTAPLAAQPLAAGEVALHIEATAQVPPDTAIVPINLVGTGKDAKAAAADLKQKEAELLAGLARLDIPRSKVEFAAEEDPRYAEVIAATELACADYPAPVTTIEAPSASAPAAPSVPRAAPVRAAVNGCEAQQARTSRMATITVEDLTKLDGVRALGGDDYYPLSQLQLFTRNPEAAKAKAVQQAIAQARAEAETYAAAMGYRVVRITRVSNAKPALNLPDIMGLIGGIAMRGRSEREEMRAMVGATMAGAAIDFVIAPK
jgi:uncharacterized protein YggE